MNPLLIDLFIILAALSLSCLSVFVAYRLGREVWKEKFEIRRVNADGEEGAIRGEYGEIAAGVMIALMVMLVDLLTPDVSILQVVDRRFEVISGFLVLIVLVVICYTSGAVRKAEVVERGAAYQSLLLKGYVPYSLYSILNYVGMVLMAGLILEQLAVNYQAYVTQQATVDRLVAAAMLDLERRPDAFTYFIEPGTAASLKMERVAEAVLARIETIYGEAIVSASRIVDQVNTLLLFVLVTFLSNFFVTYTPLSQVFEKGAIQIAHFIFYVSIGGILLLSWVLFLTIYSHLFSSVIGVVKSAAPALSGGHWEAINRFNEIRIDLTNRQGLTGFFLSLTSGRGGVLLALGAAQWVISRQTEASERKQQGPEQTDG